MKINWSALFPYIVILILFGVIWFQGCERETVTVKVPEIVREFDTITEFVYLEHRDTVFVYEDKWREIEVEIPNPVNQQLVDLYQSAQDSIGRLNIFIDAVMERQFQQTFEDDHLIGNVSGTVQGRLLGLTLDYTIKERTIEAPGTRFRLLGGFNIGNSMELSQFRWKATLGLQNGQGNIFRLGYGDNETIWIGYEASLLSF